MILYDKEKSCVRLKHTLWHEVGHIKCNHLKHSEQEEIEAHFFAAQANAPNIIIKSISKRGYTINVPFLIDCFGLSKQAAEKKMCYLNKYSFNHTNEYDDVIYEQFFDYINAKYPPKTTHFYDKYYDNMEKEREKW